MKLCALIAVAALGIALMETSREPLRAQMPAAAALTGRVTSVEEGAMEGVLVSARKAGSTITTTVVTDAQGRYRFPRTRLSNVGGQQFDAGRLLGGRKPFGLCREG
jgi:hypothetical protein